MEEKDMLKLINAATKYKIKNNNNFYVIHHEIIAGTPLSTHEGIIESKYSKKEYAEMALLTIVNRIIRETPFIISPIERNGGLQFNILRCEGEQLISGTDMYICEECNEVIKTTFYKVEDAIAELQEYLKSRTNQ